MEDVLTSTTISKQDRKWYKSVIHQFDGFFKSGRTLSLSEPGSIAIPNQKANQQKNSSLAYIT